MFKLLKFMKKYTLESILGPLFKLLEASFELCVPLVIARMVDVGIANSDTSYIVKMALVLGALGIIGLFFSVTAQYFAAKAAVGFTTELRSRLYRHIQTLSWQDLDNMTQSQLITLMTSDMNQIQTGINLSLRLLLRSPFVVFGAMIMAFTIDVKSALIFAVAIPVLAAVVFSVILSCIPLYKKVQKKLGKVLLSVRENLSGVRVVRAFCKEKEEIERFEEEDLELNKIQRFTGKISAIMNPATLILINLATVWLIHCGALRVDSGNISRGELLALYNYMSQILVELIKLANLIVSITKFIACGNRINAVMETESSQTFPQELTAARENDFALTFENVSFKYGSGASDSLTGLNFSVKKGETVGIIGGTGSGKTTLVNLIPRFYDATEGKVTVDGIDVRDYPADTLREKIGFARQKSVLFLGTVRDNLKWGNSDADDEALTQALKDAQALEVVEKKGGLDFEIEQGGRNLSGGQKQRLNVARALVRRPEILILDDSSSALDYATDAKLRRALAGLDFNPTVFVVSQRVSSISHADKIIVLDDGEAVGIGTHDSLMESCQVYREIYDSQTGGEAK